MVNQKNKLQMMSIDPLANSKYEHAILVHNLQEGYYNEDIGNLYLKNSIQGSLHKEWTSPLLIDYSNNKTKKMFDKAAKNEHWMLLYEHTKFLVNFGDIYAWFSFQFIPYDQKFLAKPFAIITAFNPYMNNEKRTYEENLKGNEELSLTLKEGKYHFLPSMGELSSYSEDSYIVYDIPLQNALEIGKKFQQQSIVYNDGKVVAIVDCETSEKVVELNHSKIYTNMSEDNQ